MPRIQGRWKRIVPNRFGNGKSAALGIALFVKETDGIRA